MRDRRGRRRARPTRPTRTTRPGCRRTAGLKHNATAAITRITGRRVVAFIPKRDKKAETSTQTFLLDRPRPRF